MSEMMKNPDKIKQALKKCRDDKCVCDECTFSEGNVKKWRELMGYALEYIQNLEDVTEESVLPVVKHVKQGMVSCRYCKAKMSLQQIGHDESDGLTYLECFYECPECGSQSPHVTELTIYETPEELADEATFMANNVYAETNRVLEQRE